MLKANAAYSGFSVDDMEKAKAFYSDILGLSVDEKDMGLHIKLPMGGMVFVYQKDDHMPASYTMMNFEVDNIEDAMQELKDSGVVFEQYEGMTGADGIAHGMENNQGPDIAWFKDPAGNIISVMQTS